MEKYAITIRETISRTIIVEADDLAEAVQRTEDAVNDGTICLNCEDCYDRDVDAADWSKDGIIPKDSNVEYYDHLYKSTCIDYLYTKTNISFVHTVFFVYVRQSKDCTYTKKEKKQNEQKK